MSETFTPEDAVGMFMKQYDDVENPRYPKEVFLNDFLVINEEGESYNYHLHSIFNRFDPNTPEYIENTYELLKSEGILSTEDPDDAINKQFIENYRKKIVFVREKLANTTEDTDYVSLINEINFDSGIENDIRETLILSIINNDRAYFSRKRHLQNRRERWNEDPTHLAVLANTYVELSRQKAISEGIRVDGWPNNGPKSPLNLPKLFKKHELKIKAFSATYEQMKKIYRLFKTQHNESFVSKYNTEDGMIRWAQDNEFDAINLAQLWSVIPKDVRNDMSEWQQINLPIQTAIEIRGKMIGENNAVLVDPNYNTEDGLIRWAIANNYHDINLGNLWTGIPKAVRHIMSEWKNINLPIQTAIEVRDKMIDKNNNKVLVHTDYNTEDGLIRWAIDNGYKDINLAHVWSVIPKDVRNIMINWQQINLPMQTAIEIRGKMIDENNKVLVVTDYNTEDGLIRWAIANNYNKIHLGNLWSVIPKDVKNIMTNWRNISLPIQTAIEIRGRMIGEKNEVLVDTDYNTEDGLIRWAIDNGYTDINLGSLWTIVPQDVRNDMGEWQQINLPMQTAIEIRGKMIDENNNEVLVHTDYNTEDGLIRWAITKGYKDINLGSLWAVIPQAVKNIMPEWKKISLPIQTAIEIRDKMIDKNNNEVLVDLEYNTKDGWIRWAIAKGYKDINLVSLWTVLPKNVQKQMPNWTYIDLSMDEFKKMYNIE